LSLGITRSIVLAVSSDKNRLSCRPRQFRCGSLTDNYTGKAIRIRGLNEHLLNELGYAVSQCLGRIFIQQQIRDFSGCLATVRLRRDENDDIVGGLIRLA